MQCALEYQSFGYGVLKRILERQATAPQNLPQHNNSPLLLPAGLNVQVEQRDLTYYQGLVFMTLCQYFVGKISRSRKNSIQGTI